MRGRLNIMTATNYEYIFVPQEESDEYAGYNNVPEAEHGEVGGGQAVLQQVLSIVHKDLKISIISALHFMLWRVQGFQKFFKVYELEKWSVGGTVLKKFLSSPSGFPAPPPPRVCPIPTCGSSFPLTVYVFIPIFIAGKCPIFVKGRQSMFITA
jgi:hypothetical protein